MVNEYTYGVEGQFKSSVNKAITQGLCSFGVEKENMYGKLYCISKSRYNPCHMDVKICLFHKYDQVQTQKAD